MNKITTILVSILGTEFAKTLIGLLVNKLLASTKDGITKDVAKIMIDGIVESKKNEVTTDLVKDVLELIKK